MSEVLDRFGIFSWFGFRLPLSERIRLIKEAGFGSTSVWLGEEEELVKTGNECLIPEIVRSHGLFLENVHAPYKYCNNIWSDSGSTRSVIKNEYGSSISFCSKHGIPIVVVHISRGDDAPKLNEHGLDVIREIVRRAEDANVTVAIENTGKPCYLNHVFSNVESPSLGFCYDSSHDFLGHSNPGTLLREWSHLLVATHLSDNDGISDRHWVPGEGNIDWEVVRDCFPKDTYTGFFTLEVLPKADEGQPVRSFLRKAIESLSWTKSLLMREQCLD